MHDRTDDQTSEAAAHAFFSSVGAFDIPTTDFNSVRTRITRRRRLRVVATTTAVVAFVVAATGALIAVRGSDPDRRVHTVSPAERQEDSRISLLAPRTNSASVQLHDGSVLTFGGIDDEAHVLFADGQIYTPREDTFEPVPEAPEPRMSATAISSASTAFFLGGFDTTSGTAAEAALIYNTAARSWDVVDTPELLGHRPPTAIVGDDAVVWGPSGRIWRLDTATRQWHTLATISRPRWSSLLDVDGRLVATGISPTLSSVDSWLIDAQDGEPARALPSLTSPDGYVRTGIVETATLGTHLVAWGHNYRTDSTGKHADVSTIDLSTPNPSWTTIGSINVVNADSWLHVTTSSTIWTWQITGTYAAITPQGVGERNEPVPDTFGDLFPLSAESYLVVNPGVPAGDSTPGPNTPTYRAIGLPTS